MKIKAIEVPIGTFYENVEIIGKQILPLGVVVLQTKDNRPNLRFAPETIITVKN